MKKSDKILYITLFVIWFFSMFLDNSTLPLWVRISAMIVKELCFYTFLTHMLFRTSSKHINNKKFTFAVIGISLFSFALSGVQSVLYQIRNPDSVLFSIFVFFLPAIFLLCFIFDKREKRESLKTPKNIAILLASVLFTIIFLAINIMGIIDLVKG